MIESIAMYAILIHSQNIFHSGATYPSVIYFESRELCEEERPHIKRLKYVKKVSRCIKVGIEHSFISEE